VKKLETVSLTNAVYGVLSPSASQLVSNWDSLFYLEFVFFFRVTALKVKD